MAGQVTDLEELKKESTNGGDFFILLNYGLKSSKHICFHKESNQFEIYNSIDGSQQLLTEKELIEGEQSNIYEAIKKRALFKE